MANIRTLSAGFSHFFEPAKERDVSRAAGRYLVAAKRTYMARRRVLEAREAAKNAKPANTIFQSFMLRTRGKSPGPEEIAAMEDRAKRLEEIKKERGKRLVGCMSESLKSSHKQLFNRGDLLAFAGLMVNEAAPPLLDRNKNIQLGGGGETIKDKGRIPDAIAEMSRKRKLRNHYENTWNFFVRMKMIHDVAERMSAENGGLVQYVSALREHNLAVARLADSILDYHNRPEADRHGAKNPLLPGYLNEIRDLRDNLKEPYTYGEYLYRVGPMGYPTELSRMNPQAKSRFAYEYIKKAALESMQSREAESGMQASKDTPRHIRIGDIKQRVYDALNPYSDKNPAVVGELADIEMEIKRQKEMLEDEEHHNMRGKPPRRRSYSHKEPVIKDPLQIYHEGLLRIRNRLEQVAHGSQGADTTPIDALIKDIGSMRPMQRGPEGTAVPVTFKGGGQDLANEIREAISRADGTIMRLEEAKENMLCDFRRRLGMYYNPKKIDISSDNWPRKERIANRYLEEIVHNVLLMTGASCISSAPKESKWGALRKVAHGVHMNNMSKILNEIES